MPKISIDLHIHSQYSDGKFKIKELVGKIKKAGVKIASLTDHDTVEGWPEFSRESVKAGIIPLSGVEISVFEDDVGIHLLGFNVNPNHKKLQNIFIRQTKERAKNLILVIECFRKAGFKINKAKLVKLKKLKAVAKPHIFELIYGERSNRKILAEKYNFHVGKDAQSRFIQEFLHQPGQLGYVHKDRVGSREAINAIHAAGGLAIWAHPIIHEDIKGKKHFEKLLRSLIKLGLDGMEVFSCAHSRAETKYLSAIAKRNKLLATIGSDDHDGLRLGKLSVPSADQRSLRENLIRSLNKSPHSLMNVGIKKPPLTEAKT